MTTAAWLVAVWLGLVAGEARAQEGSAVAVTPTGAIEALVLDLEGRPCKDDWDVEVRCWPLAIGLDPPDDHERVSRAPGVEGRPGIFRAAELSPGPYGVRARYSWLGSSEVVVVTVAALEAVTCTARASRGVPLRGRVVDDLDAPLAGIRVSESAGCYITRVRSAVTGADGSFTILGHDVTPTARWVNADDPSRRHLPGGAIVRDGGTLIVERAAFVRGTVRDASGAPVLQPTEPDRAQPFPVDPRGGFEMLVRAGPGAVRVAAPGLATATAGYLAVAGAVTEVALVLGAPSTIEGVVVSSDGAPVAGAFVSFDDAPFRWPSEEPVAGRIRGYAVHATWVPAEATRSALEDGGAVRSDEAGRFRLEGVPTGRRTVVAAAARLGPGAATLDVPAGATVEARVVLGPGAAIECTLRGEDGAPIADADFWITRPEEAGSTVGRPEEGPAGTFSVRGIEPGDYEVRASGDAGEGWISCERRVTVAEGRTVRLDFVAPRAQRYVARVRFEGAPPGLRVGDASLVDDLTGRREARASIDEEVGDAPIEMRLSGALGGRHSLSFYVHGFGGEDLLDVRVSPRWRAEGATLAADVVVPSGRIEGAVVDEDGRPAPGTFRVSVFQPGEVFPLAVASKMTASGSFSLGVIGEGPFDVQAQAVNGVVFYSIEERTALPADLDGEALARGARPGGPPVALVLRRGARLYLRGRIEDAAALVRAEVRVARAPGGAWRACGGWGGLESPLEAEVGPLASGVYDVLVVASGAGLLRIRGVEVGTEDARRAFVLPPPAAVSVEVRRRGAPLAGARVDLLWVEDGSAVPFVSEWQATDARATDVAGVARRRGLAPGAYIVRVTTLEGAVVDAPGTLRANETASVIVEVP